MSCLSKELQDINKNIAAAKNESIRINTQDVKCLTVDKILKKYSCFFHSKVGWRSRNLNYLWVISAVYKETSR